MKKHVSNFNLANKLLQYSKLSAVFVLLKSGDVATQVVYGDLEPDIVLANDGEEYYLDINNDTQNDFRFSNEFREYGGYWTSGSIYYIFFNSRQEINAFALNENDVAGIEVNFDTYSSGTFPWHFAYALDQNDMINSALEFAGLMLAIKTLLWSYANDGAGYWYPELLDHYLGVRFKDNDENTHYGWIRCDVKDEGHTLVIKDYAYETETDYPIVAGDTIQFVGINNLENTINATVYSYGKDIYIHIETFQNTEVIIFDLGGKEIIKDYLRSENESMNMANYPSGIYLLTLLKEGKRFDKKINIE